MSSEPEKMELQEEKVESPTSTKEDEDLEEVRMEEAPGEPIEVQHTEETKHPTTPVGVAGYHLDIDNRVLPYVGMIVAAVVLLVAILVPDYDLENKNYTISVCAIVFAFGFAGMFVATSPELHDRELGEVPSIGPITVGTGLAIFLFTWNFIGAGILTFNGPFLITSNGYFASWFLVYFAVLALGFSADSLSSRVKGLGYCNGLAVAALVQICAVSSDFGEPDKWECIYSLIVSIFSIFLVVASEKLENMEKVRFPIFVLFALLWIVLACVVTFRGPFLLTGNGYFSAWIGCALSLYAAAAVRPQ